MGCSQSAAAQEPDTIQPVSLSAVAINLEPAEPTISEEQLRNFYKLFDDPSKVDKDISNEDIEKLCRTLQDRYGVSPKDSEDDIRARAAIWKEEEAAKQKKNPTSLPP